MLDLLGILLLLSGLFVGWNIGANDAATSIGPTIGAGILNYRRALILFSVFAILGAAIQGFHTINSVGSGIIDTSSTPITSLISVLLATTLMVTLLSLFGIPVSTTQSIMGGIAAIGISQGIKTNWGQLSVIFFSGLITPIVAIIFGYIIYKYVGRYVFSLPFLGNESLITTLLIASSAFLAYSIGSNGIGNAMGLVVGKGIIGLFLGGLLGGIALAIGAATLGKRVIKTVSSEIMAFDAVMALSMQFALGLTLYGFTLFGIPVSTTAALLGSMIGVGLVKGIASLDMGTVKKITLGWFTSPLIAALLTVLISKIW